MAFVGRHSRSAVAPGRRTERRQWPGSTAAPAIARCCHARANARRLRPGTATERLTLRGFSASLPGEGSAENPASSESKKNMTTNTTSTMTVRIIANDKGNPPGKLADAELHFSGGPVLRSPL